MSETPLLYEVYVYSCIAALLQSVKPGEWGLGGAPAPADQHVDAFGSDNQNPGPAGAWGLTRMLLANSVRQEGSYYRTLHSGVALQSYGTSTNIPGIVCILLLQVHSCICMVLELVPERIFSCITYE